MSAEDIIERMDEEAIKRAVLAERERCAKIAEEARKEIVNAPHAMSCKTEWHGNVRTPCNCFKFRALAALGKIRSGE